MKLYAVTLETEVYCVADSPEEATQIAESYKHQEDFSGSARLATWVEGDWVDCPPYAARSAKVEDRTCAEWLALQKGE